MPKKQFNSRKVNREKSKKIIYEIAENFRFLRIKWFYGISLKYKDLNER